MFQSSRAVFSLSRSRKISEPSRASHKKFHFIFFACSPHLSQIAKVYLTLSASSVPVESMFSLAGLVKNLRRSSVAPHRLNCLCFVHDNYANFFSNEIIQPLLWTCGFAILTVTVISNLCIIKLVLCHLSWEAPTVLVSSHPSRDSSANLA